MQSDENIASLQETYTNKASHTQWTEAAHMLKGGAAGLGASKLHELCEKAQVLPHGSNEKNALLQQITEEYQRIKAAFKEMGY